MKVYSLVLSLTLISAVCAGVLAYVNNLTKAPIEATKVANEEKAVKAVMPSGVVTVESCGADTFVGKDKSGAVIGYAAKGADAGGYGGDIVLMVGFEADKKTVVCYKTLQAAETPGLGMKLNMPEFANQFVGQDGASVKVRKDGGKIDAITSATITSRAVCRAVQAAGAHLMEFAGKEK